MDNIAKIAFIGNFLQTIWFVVLIVGILLNSTFKALHFIPATAGGGAGIFAVIAMIIFMILSWMAERKLEDNAWRLILLVVAILSILYTGSLIAGILFIVAFVKSGKRV